MDMNRRKFMQNLGVKAALGLGASSVLAAKTCESLITPAQPLGPFYPRVMPADTDADLTRVSGRARSAVGETVLVKGIVQDEFCRPIKGAIVEIWQACKSGKYNHPSDTSDSALDPNFQYYAMVKTNERGEYSFKTILPGAYNASATWIRPPHIHFKVSLRGYEELVTQLYFKGQDLNRHDRILQDLSQEEQQRVVVEFKPDEVSKLLTGNFIINLKHL
tara:strand:- start:38651 stop:39307 length:657 start_codon:yes stop_codon:yes gene_type:complete